MTLPGSQKMPAATLYAIFRQGQLISTNQSVNCNDGSLSLQNATVYPNFKDLSCKTKA